jgi:hypothetical protein
MKRYCEMCDTWVSKAVCPECGLKTRRPEPALKVGQSVRIMTMARTDAVGVITHITPRGYEVRLPNWQADGVCLNVHVRKDEVETGHGRAQRCRCPFLHRVPTAPMAD